MDQKTAALKRANAVRIARADWKKKVRADRERAAGRIAEALADPPPELESASVLELLMAAPRIGRGKANRILFRQQITPTRRLDELTPRQRHAIAQELGVPVLNTATPRDERVMRTPPRNPERASALSEEDYGYDPPAAA